MAKGATSSSLRKRNPVDVYNDFRITGMGLSFWLPKPQDVSNDNPVIVTGSYKVLTPDGKPQANIELDINETEQPFQNVTELKLDGKKLAQGRDYKVHVDKTGKRYILIKRTVRNGATITTSVDINAAANGSGEGLYISTDKVTGVQAYLTQGESEGFRKIIPFPDRPSVAIDGIRTQITAPKGFNALLASGALVKNEKGLKNQRGMHTKTWVVNEQPMPSYTFATVAGKMDVITAPYKRLDGTTIHTEAYTDPGLSAYAYVPMASQHAMMHWDENPKTYDYRCPFPHLKMAAFSSFQNGAMENITLTVFNDQKFLVHPKLSTSAMIYDGIRVPSHETAHNLTGDEITICDFTEPGFKEGFTTYRGEICFLTDLLGVGERIRRIQQLRSSQFQDANGLGSHAIITDPNDPNDRREAITLYDDTTYQKGAFLYGVLHTMLGNKDFYNGMRAFRKKWSGKAAKFDDFLAAMAKTSGKDLSQYKLWWTQAATPKVTTRWAYDAKQKAFTLFVEQRVANGQPVPIPLPVQFTDHKGNLICAQLQNADGSSEVAEKIIIDQARQSFTFTGFTDPKHLPIIAFGSHLVPVQFDWHSYRSQDLATLMQAKALDPMMRYEASQQLLRQILAAAYNDPQGEFNGAQTELLFEAYKNILPESGTDLNPEVKAAMLQAPSVEEMVLTVSEGQGDYQKLSDIRKALRQKMRQHLAPHLNDAFVNHVPGELKISKNPKHWERELKEWGEECMQKLSLRTATLSLLNAGEMPCARELAREIVADPKADITERCAAAVIIDSWGTHEGDVLVAKFTRELDATGYQPLIGHVKKLLSASGRADAFSRVRAMVTDAMTNPGWVPNDIYNTLTAYLGGNIADFHTNAAQSYRWVADVVCSVGAAGKDVSATKILRFMVRDVPTLPADKQDLMKNAFKHMHDSGKLGLGAADMVNRALRLLNDPTRPWFQKEPAQSALRAA